MLKWTQLEESPATRQKAIDKRRMWLQFYAHFPT